MRILIDGRMYGTEHTGIGRYTKNLVEQLQKIDKENDYLILLREKHFKNLELNDNWEKIKADYRHYSVKEQTSLAMLINKLDFDVAHFPHFNVPILINKPFIVTIHDVIMHKSHGKNATTLPTYFYALKRFGYHKVFNNAVKKSLKIITPTNYVKEDILNRFNVKKKKIEVINEGLDSLVKPVKNNEKNYKKKFGELYDRKYFIYAGNAYPHKNLKRLIEAFSILVTEEDHNVDLVLVTKNNNFRADLQKYILEKNVDNKVHFFEKLSDDELGYLYKNSLAFIYPSLEEGFGLQGLETVSNGSLIACSDIRVFKEVYDNLAIYFNPHNFNSIKKAMADILDLNQTQRKNLIKKQTKILKNYSLKKMAEKTLNIYNSLK